MVMLYIQTFRWMLDASLNFARGTPAKMACDLTFGVGAVDTGDNAELKEIRNCGHGHVYVYGVRTHPCGS
jgi:hypothetical protein